MSKIEPPKKNALLGHFLDKNYHTPQTDGVIESSVGARRGEAFKGRLIKGDGTATMTVSFITGTMTVKAAWVKNALLEVLPGSATFEDVVNGTEPLIDLITEVSGNVITLQNEFRYWAIRVYDDGVLVGFYPCEYGAGVTQYDMSGNGNHLAVVNYAEQDWYQLDSEVPYSYLNTKGYNSLAGAQLDESYPITVTTTNPTAAPQVMTDSNTSRKITFQQSGSFGVVSYPGTFTQHGWHGGRYYMTSDSSAVGSQLLSINGGYKSATVILKGEKVQSASISIEGRDTSIWSSLRDKATTEGYDFSRYSAAGNGAEFVYLITGNDATEGDDYPASVGFTGLTSTEVRVWLSDWMHDVDAFRDFVWDDFTAGGSTWNSVGSYTLIGIIFDGSFISEKIFSVEVGLGDFVFAGNLSANTPGNDYFNGNINQPVNQLSSITFRHQNNLMDVMFDSIKISDKPLVPAMSRTHDALNIKLTASGKVRQIAQLKQSNCLIGNGIWNFTFPSNITSLLVGDIDVSPECTIAGGKVTPNNGLELYDLTINGSSHYPCANGNQLFIQDADGLNPLTLVDGIIGDMWGLQDVYHWNAIKGIWRSTLDSLLFSTYKVDVNYERFEGLKRTRSIPVGIESKIQFPDTPEVRAANIDPDQQFSMQDFVDKNAPSTFREVKSNRLGELLTYNLLIPGEFPCFSLLDAEIIPFTNMTDWDHITHKGTALVDLNTGALEIECTSSGTIYDLRVFDVNGNWIAWFPVCVGGDDTTYDVMGGTNIGTLPNTLGWDKQNVFDYNGVYGGGKPKSFEIKSSDTPTVFQSYLPTNLARIEEYNSTNGVSYKVTLVQDLNGDLINDPDGEVVGWNNINGIDVLNIYNDFADANISPVSGSNLLTPAGLYPSALIKIKAEFKQGDIHAFTGRDSSMVGRFNGESILLHGKKFSDQLSTPADLFNAINGGVETSGTHPNGANPNFPSTDLGMTMANGYSSDITSLDIVNVLNNHVFTNQGTAELFLDGLVLDGINTNLLSGRWSYTLTRSFSILLGNGSSNYNIELSTENFEADGALSNLGNTFMQNYEKVLETYSNMKLRYAYGGGTVPIWARIRQFSIDAIAESRPAKYIGRLKRSNETVIGNEVENVNELKTKGDTAFKAVALTKSTI